MVSGQSREKMVVWNHFRHTARNTYDVHFEFYHGSEVLEECASASASFLSAR